MNKQKNHPQEPGLTEILGDPIVRLVMERDDVTEDDIRSLFSALTNKQESVSADQKLVA